jgi:hypothetical protein
VRTDTEISVCKLDFTEHNELLYWLLKKAKQGNKQLLQKKGGITFTIPGMLEIIRKPGNATNHSVIMAAFKNLLAIRKHPGDKDVSYIKLRTYFHLLCNYSQTNILISIGSSPPSPPKIIPLKTFTFQTVELSEVAVHMDKQRQLVFLDTIDMGLKMDM